MPKTRPLTAALQREADEADRRKRTIRIINTAAVASGLDRRQLADRSNIEYQTFNHRMRGESDFRLSELSRIANVLHFDVGTRAAVTGAKEKCRYEEGYREA